MQHRKEKKRNEAKALRAFAQASHVFLLVYRCVWRAAVRHVECDTGTETGGMLLYLAEFCSFLGAIEEIREKLRC
jgi:hypothetical protein